MWPKMPKGQQYKHQIVAVPWIQTLYVPESDNVCLTPMKAFYVYDKKYQVELIASCKFPPKT